MSQFISYEKHTYKFENIKKINYKELYNCLENYFFQNPFNNIALTTCDAVNKARFNFIFKLVDLIRMIEDHNREQNIYTSQILWNRGEVIYTGHVYAFELKKGGIILLKTVRC